MTADQLSDAPTAVADPASVAAAADWIRDSLGRADILVNKAARS